MPRTIDLEIRNLLKCKIDLELFVIKVFLLFVSLYRNHQNSMYYCEKLTSLLCVGQ